jgi:hypothetical protein
VYMYLRANNSEHGIAGTPYYVGKGRGDRAYSTNRKITRRPTDLSRIVFVATGLKEPDAFQLEMLLIYIHGRIDLGTGCLRNKTDGGEGQHGVHKPHTEEWKQWMKEHPNSGQFKLGHPSGWRKGSKLSEEHKLKVSIAGKGRLVSEETRAKIGAAHKGSLRSQEARERMSASHKGKPWSEKQRAARVKPTHCLHGHEFTPENTRLKRRRGRGNPVRACRQCDRDYKVRSRNSTTCCLAAAVEASISPDSPPVVPARVEIEAFDL